MLHNSIVPTQDTGNFLFGFFGNVCAPSLLSVACLPCDGGNPDFSAVRDSPSSCYPCAHRVCVLFLLSFSKDTQPLLWQKQGLCIFLIEPVPRPPALSGGSGPVSPFLSPFCYFSRFHMKILPVIFRPFSPKVGLNILFYRQNLDKSGSCVYTECCFKAGNKSYSPFPGSRVFKFCAGNPFRR